MHDLVHSLPSIPRRILLQAMAIALLVSAALTSLGILYPIDAVLYAMRSQVAQKPIRDDVVLIGIDDKALVKHGGWPWDRQILANEIEKMDKAGARRILFDMQFLDRGLGQNDPLLKAANNAKADVYFGVLPETMTVESDFQVSDGRMDDLLIPAGNKLVYLGMNYDFMGTPVNVPVKASVSIDGKNIEISGIASKIKDYSRSKKQIKIDQNIISNLKIHSINDWEKNAIVKDKKVLIALEAPFFNDFYRVPFKGYVNGGILHLMASSSFQVENPYFGFIASIFILITSFGISFVAKSGNLKKLLFVQLFALAAIFFSGWLMERAGYDFEFAPFMVASALFLGITKNRYGKHLASIENGTDSLTGLPNGTAHVRAIEAAGNANRVIVAATIGNSSDISCILNEEKILDFYREVERRILSSNGADVIYHAGYDSVTWDVPKAIFPDVDDYAKAMRAMMLQPFVIDGQSIRADLSYGFDLDTGLSAYRRLANALNASQRAAASHKLFADNMLASDNSASWRVALSSSVEQLLEAGQFSLAFQPKLNLSTGLVESAECLMRWTHPDYGAIPPSEFIDAAEQGSAIVDLTHFALESAMQSLTQFRRTRPNFTLAVNLSPSLLDDRDLAARIIEGLDSYGLERSALILEITEAARLADRSTAMDVLDALANGGVPLSIDDYGTGRSTLDYLRVIPAKEIKLDRSFIGDMIVNEQNRNLVESTIKLAQTLNLSTVAEGVENRETLTMLQSMGCTFVQGYHIGWPLALEPFTKKFIMESNAFAA